MNDTKRRILTISIAVLILLGVFMGMYTADVRARRSAGQRAEAVLLDSAREQAETFAAALSGQFDVLESVALLLSLDTAASDAQVAARLDAIEGTAEKGFSSIDLIYPDGTAANGPFYDINVADRPYFLEAMAGARAMERVVGRETGRGCMVLSVPYYRNGTISGVIRGTYYEEDMRALVSSEAYGGAGYSFLVCGHGDIVVNTEDSALHIDEDNLYDAFANAVLRKGTLEELQEDLRTGQSSTLHYTYKGNARVAALAPLGGDRLPPNDWFVLNVVSEDRLLGEVQSSRRDSIESMSIFAVFSLSALGLFFLLEWDNRRRKRQEAEIIRQNEEQFRIVTEQSEKHVMRYDIPSRTAYRNDTRADGFGGEASCRDMAEESIRRGYIDPVSEADFRAFFEKIDAGESPVTMDFLMHKPNGERRWYRHIATTIFDKNGHARTAVISYHDDTEQREREMAYAKWQQELESMSYDSAALYEWNLTKDMPEGQRGVLAAKYEGLPAEAFNARTDVFVRDHVFAEDRQAFAAMMNREHLLALYFSGTHRSSLEYRFVTDDGTLRYREISVQLVPYPDTQDIKAYVTNRDVDEKKRETLAMVESAQQDSLTGVLNRGTFVSRVDQGIAAAPAAMHAILMLDVDGFKRINDTLGHDAGDKVLRELADNIRGVLRAGDMVGRIGGDEFMVFLPDMPFDAAIGKKAEQICAALRRVLDESLPISVSIGIAVYPRDGANFAELYRSADAALYHAKHSGKDGYVFYRSGMSSTVALTDMDTTT